MSRLTIQEQACMKVPAFSGECKTFIRKFGVAGKSSSCVQNYLRQISKLVLFYGRSAVELSSEDVEEFLVYLRRNEPPSLSSFKHLVYGLRHLYSIYGREDIEVILPEISHPKTLPAVFSKEEVRSLLKAPGYLKHRLLLGTIYDGGLRVSEVSKLLISDVDFDRLTIHVRESKFKKDRYVPISSMLANGLKSYLNSSYPKYYLFNGKQKGTAMSVEGIRHVMRGAMKKSGIRKNASVHSLRHSYATHLLEDGLDLVSLKNQMGHSRIENTMIYIHIARVSSKRGFSPLQTLYPVKEKGK
jgi:site-specific recombinase XerD